jgi:magnesium chelatase subunit I
MDITRLRTLGQLKAANYRSRSVKTELRENLLTALREGRPIFKGIYDYEDTVLPQLRTAILARHDILLLGLRGQAKTRLARLMVELLDPYIPAIEGTELPEDPFHPITAEGQLIVTEAGDDTPIRWISREERYIEKLATPDVSVADLIGDIDPIKAATLKLPYSDPRVIHYGLIPRAHRGLFVINELPDLQPPHPSSPLQHPARKRYPNSRLQLPFAAGYSVYLYGQSEDYTQRGTIITPLKDRIGSQILTHYPRTLEASRRITQQEARIHPETKARVIMPDVIANTIERIGMIARQSEYIDQKSGVSAPPHHHRLRMYHGQR